MTYLFYGIIEFFVRYFPLKFNYAMSRFLADIFCLFPTKLKQDVHYNLSEIYKLKGEEVEISKKVREVFRNFARYLIDLICLDVLPQEKLDKLFLDIEGREYLDAVKSKGAILVTIHMGNWELGGAFLTHNGYDFTAIFEKHENEKLTRFFNNIRLKHKFGIVYRKDIKGIVQVIKDKKVLTILGDLNYDNQTIPVKFLGVDYDLPAGAIVLALKYNVPVISAICVQSGSGYKIIVSDLLKLEKSGNLNKDIQNNAQKLAEILEDFIVKYPEQWFVFKRFDKNEK